MDIGGDTLLIYVLSGIILLLLVQDTIILFRLLAIENEYVNSTEIELPHVAVLVAARNEADNIDDCVNALVNSNYPQQKFQILLGNDASDDATYDKMMQWQKNYPQLIKVYDIFENKGNARGKANVLAHLAVKDPKAVLLCITDADVVVNRNWLRNYAELWVQHRPAVMTGITGIGKATLWGAFQHYDWLFAIGMVKVAHDLGIPSSAMGNNMAVSAKAYNAIGGYEQLPFSVTEDFALFQALKQQGGDSAHVVSVNIYAISKPAPSFKQLIAQRTRWMVGAMLLPWPMVAMLGLQALYFPVLLIMLYLQPVMATCLFLLKVSLQSACLLRTTAVIKEKNHWLALILYELYSCTISIASLFQYLISGKIVWKGRVYNK